MGRLFLGEVVVRSLAGKSIGGALGQRLFMVALGGRFLFWGGLEWRVFSKKKGGESDA